MHDAILQRVHGLCSADRVVDETLQQELDALATLCQETTTPDRASN